MRAWSLSATVLDLAGSPAAVRARMLLAAPWAATRGAAPDRALARALRAVSLGRACAEERRWLERIARRRRELETRRQEISSGVERSAGELPAWARHFDRPIPLWGGMMMLSIPATWGSFLFHLVRELRPRSCLELGTAFGLSALYQAAALELNGEGAMIALDAAGEWGGVAEEGFASLGLSDRVEFRAGHLSETLGPAVSDGGPVDFALIDAEHEGDATRAHFETLLPGLADPAVVVFDDIWSPHDMRHAWRAIRAHDQVRSAYTLARMGVVIIGR
ncbi:MAG: O-methyltransferase [Solirubrobacterales bacterium]